MWHDNPMRSNGWDVGLWREVREQEIELARQYRMFGYITADNWGDPVASRAAVSECSFYIQPWPWCRSRKVRKGSR